MVRILSLIIFIAMSYTQSISAAVSTNERDSEFPLADGIYFGRQGGWRTPCIVFVTVQGGKVKAEVYQPLKGQMIAVLTDDLSLVRQNKLIGLGKDTAIIKEGSTLSLRSISDRGKIFKSIVVELRPEKEPFWHECRNRSYINADYTQVYSFLQAKVGNTINWRQTWSDFFNVHDVWSMAQTLRHNEFLTKYSAIRAEVISEIITRSENVVRQPSSTSLNSKKRGK